MPNNIVRELSERELELLCVKEYFESNPKKNKCPDTLVNPFNGKVWSVSYLREPNGIFAMAENATTINQKEKKRLTLNPKRAFAGRPHTRPLYI